MNGNWKQRGLRSAMLFFVGGAVTVVTLAVAGLLVVVWTTYQRSLIDEQIKFLAKNIESASANLILTKELMALESVLKVNANFPFVTEIRVVDKLGKLLAEVRKVDGRVESSYDLLITLPEKTDHPLLVKNGKPIDDQWWDKLVPDFPVLEVWHPINEKSLLGSIRIRYDLGQLEQVVTELRREALLFGLIVIVLILFLLSLLLRQPMRELRDTIRFAARLNQKLGSQHEVRSGIREFVQLGQTLNSLSTQLRFQQLALDERMEHNQVILDHLLDGVVTTDAIGTIRSFSEAAGRIFGYALDDVLARNVRLLMPDWAALNPTSEDDDGREGMAQILVVAQEVQGQRKDGSCFAMELTASSSTDRDELVYICVMRDISERRRLERLKSEFIATVSHELRTPLTSIHGALKLLTGGVGGTLPAVAEKLITVAQNNSQRLLILVNDLLDMEKLVAGKMTINLAPVDIVALAQQAVQDNAAYAELHQVSLSLAPQASGKMVMADASRVLQVLANMLSNAAKFSRPSTTVNLRIITNENDIRVEIQDHGHGIPADFHKEIFSAFSQASSGNVRQQGGTGLGLKISKALIDAMQGEIGFLTADDIGSTFWFSLPLAGSDGGMVAA